MKKLLIGIIVTISFSSYASTGFLDNSSEAIDGVGVCQFEALKKLVSFASDNNANKIKVETFRLVGNDKTIYKPSYYSWYEIDVEINGEVKIIGTLVQKNRLNDECL